MNKKQLLLLAITLPICLIFPKFVTGQENRYAAIEKQLAILSKDVPGLNQKVETAVSNGSLQEVLQGIASTHNLNIHIDPSINQKVTLYFSNEKVSNVLLYLAKQYMLDFAFTNTIISIFPYKDSTANKVQIKKDPQIEYNGYKGLISLNLSDDSLLLVTKKITSLSDKNIIVLPDLVSKKISGFIKDMPVENALEKIAISNNFKLNKTTDGVYIIEPLKQDEELMTKQSGYNPNYNIKKNIRSGANQSSSSIVVQQIENGTKLISLNVNNTPIKDVIKNIAEQAGINYFVYSDISGSTTANIQSLEFDKALNYLLQGTKYTYNSNNGVYMIGERQNEGLRASKLIQLKYRSVDSLLSIIPQELKEGIEIKEFKELNSFLVSGSQPRITELEGFVNELDRTVPLVMIEVILMDVKKSKTITTGIKIGVSDSTVKPGGTLLGGFDYTFGASDINRFIDQLGLNNAFNIGRVSPNFYASLKALENNNNIDLRQTPKLSTLNGHSATLSIGSKRYYSIKTQNVIGSFTPQTVVTEQYIPVEANLSINLVPFVSGNEHVTLSIDVDISDFLGTPSINVPPPSASSKFHSIIRVRNEEMIVLGGIERTEKSDEGSGTPLLSRIPVLKWFFSSRTKVNSKTVSVVFIKPTIIY